MTVKVFLYMKKKKFTKKKKKKRIPFTFVKNLRYVTRTSRGNLNISDGDLILPKSRFSQCASVLHLVLSSFHQGPPAPHFDYCTNVVLPRPEVLVIFSWWFSVFFLWWQVSVVGSRPYPVVPSWFSFHWRH